MPRYFSMKLLFLSHCWHFIGSSSIIINNLLSAILILPASVHVSMCKFAWAWVKSLTSSRHSHLLVPLLKSLQHWTKRIQLKQTRNNHHHLNYTFFTENKYSTVTLPKKTSTTLRQPVQPQMETHFSSSCLQSNVWNFLSKNAKTR